MSTDTEVSCTLFRSYADEAKRLFMAHTLIEQGGERWTLKLEDAAYYAARANITTIEDAKALLVAMIDLFPAWDEVSDDSRYMVGEASGWVMMAQDIFVAFCQLELMKDPFVKREVEKRSRQSERTPRELARIKSVLKI